MWILPSYRRCKQCGSYITIKIRINSSREAHERTQNRDFRQVELCRLSDENARKTGQWSNHAKSKSNKQPHKKRRGSYIGRRLFKRRFKVRRKKNLCRNWRKQ